MTKFKELQTVVLLHDLGESYIVAPGRGKTSLVDGKPGIARGTLGAIVDLQSQDGFTVEFFDDDGQTIGVPFVAASLLRPATEADYSARSSSRTA
jgi:hypothetical protein